MYGGAPFAPETNLKQNGPIIVAMSKITLYLERKREHACQIPEEENGSSSGPVFFPIQKKSFADVDLRP